MNRKDKIPEIPPILPMPIPEYESYLTIKKSRAIIIILLFMILNILVITFYRTDEVTNWRIVCEHNISTSYNNLPKNNIQAAHVWDMKPYKLPENNDGFFCVGGVNDIGPLWGSSMQPTFFEGNTVLLKDYYINNVTLHTGDIVRFFRFNNEIPNCTVLHNDIMNNSLGGAYVNNSMAVIHRINAIYDDVIVVQGDNLNQMETIDRCQITDVVLGIFFT